MQARLFLSVQFYRKKNEHIKTNHIPFCCTHDPAILLTENTALGLLCRTHLLHSVPDYVAAM